MPLLAISSSQRHYVFGLLVCPCICVWYTESLSTWYPTNCLWEFHQIYNLGTVGDKGEVIRFGGQEVKSHCHKKTKIMSSKITWQKFTFPAIIRLRILSSFKFLSASLNFACFTNNWSFYILDILCACEPKYSCELNSVVCVSHIALFVATLIATLHSIHLETSTITRVKAAICKFLELHCL